MLHGGARAPVIFEKARQFNLQNVAIYRCRDVLLSEEKDQRVHGELLIWFLTVYYSSRPLRRLYSLLLVVKRKRGSHLKQMQSEH
jgi:hypothetical protein